MYQDIQMEFINDLAQAPRFNFMLLEISYHEFHSQLWCSVSLERNLMVHSKVPGN